jgi:hypothetical protein
MMPHEWFLVLLLLQHHKMLLVGPLDMNLRPHALENNNTTKIFFVTFFAHSTRNFSLGRGSSPLLEAIIVHKNTQQYYMTDWNPKTLPFLT